MYTISPNIYDINKCIRYDKKLLRGGFTTTITFAYLREVCVRSNIFWIFSLGIPGRLRQLVPGIKTLQQFICGCGHAVKASGHLKQGFTGLSTL